MFTAPAPDNTVGKMDKNGVVIPPEINEPASEICKRKVTGEKILVEMGYEKFQMGDTEVSIGNSGNNSKTSADSYNLSSNACPTRVDKSNTILEQEINIRTNSILLFQIVFHLQLPHQYRWIHRHHHAQFNNEKLYTKNVSINL